MKKLFTVVSVLVVLRVCENISRPSALGAGGIVFSALTTALVEL